jgi:hypothetical protein
MKSTTKTSLSTKLLFFTFIHLLLTTKFLFIVHLIYFSFSSPHLFLFLTLSFFLTLFPQFYFFLGIYDTRDHDKHHSNFEMNYGFPFPYLDLFHGTYQGKFLGFDIIPSNKIRKVSISWNSLDITNISAVFASLSVESNVKKFFRTKSTSTSPSIKKIIVTLLF